MKTQSKWMILGSAVCALTIAAVAHAGLSKIGNADVVFKAKGPGGLSIDGSAHGFQASEAGGKLTMSVDLNTIKTGIKLRDDHTKKAVKAGAHPQAKLVVDRSKLKMPANNATSEGTAPGSLSINGKTKPVSVHYKAKRTGSDYHVKGSISFKYTDFIEKQCYLKVCVDPEVKIRANFKVREK